MWDSSHTHTSHTINQIGASHFNFPRFLIRGLQYLPCLLGNSHVRNPVELIWRHAIKIVLSALLLAFDTTRVALSHVDLAAFGFVQPISTASQTASSIEHKNALIRTFQKA